MRFVILMFVAATLAGCATDSDSSDEPVLDQVQLFTEDLALYSHPSYGYGVNSALFETPDGRLYEDVGEARKWYATPFYGTPGNIGTLEPLANTEEANTGGGIAILGGLAFIGGRGAGPLYIYDIMDHQAPRLLDTVEDVPVRDADTILFPDGRLIVITTAGGRNIFATDATDPTNATHIADFEVPGSTHNIAVVPGAPIVYDSGRDIVDFSDPENPVLVGKAPGSGTCHDIAFHIDTSIDKVWALCAGYSNTEIWDISNATAPVIISTIAYPSIDKGLPIVGGALDDEGVPQDVTRPASDVVCPVLPGPVSNVACPISAAHPSSFSHLAITNHDATVLIMGDETGGGGSNQCDFYYEGPDGTTHSGPIGNVWFYDITDPQNPDLRGHVSPSATDADPPGPAPGAVPPVDRGGSCTAHFGKVIEDTGFVAIGFYSAGFVLIDFNDLDNPRIADRLDQGGDIWDVWYNRGVLYTGDMVRGMDVIGLS